MYKTAKDVRHSLCPDFLASANPIVPLMTSLDRMTYVVSLTLAIRLLLSTGGSKSPAVAWRRYGRENAAKRITVVLSWVFGGGLCVYNRLSCLHSAMKSEIPLLDQARRKQNSAGSRFPFSWV